MSALKRLKQSKEFSSLGEKIEGIYFSYAMTILENNKSTPWRLGFYHKSTDKMMTFIVDEGEIKMEKEEEIFKKPGMEVKKVDIEKIKIPYGEILKKAEELRKNRHPNELARKTIVILQNLGEFGNIWNITYVTHSFKTLNIKINAENGKILHHSLDSLMDFVKK